TQPTDGLGHTRPSPRRASPKAACRWAASRASIFGTSRELAEEVFEVLGLAEITIDRGEPHIGDGVERRESVHHHLADDVRRDFAFAQAFQAAHDAVDDTFEPLVLHRALAGGDLDRPGELLAVERLLFGTRFLDHHQLAQLHPLEGGKARTAIGAKAAPANRGIVLGRARILHLGIVMAAERAAHRVSFRSSHRRYALP